MDKDGLKLIGTDRDGLKSIDLNLNQRTKRIKSKYESTAGIACFCLRCI